MFATYVLGGQQWDFRSDSDRTLLWDQATFRWASLKGRSIKLRSTPRPYPSYEFARTLDEDTPEPAARRAGRPGLGRVPGVRAAPAAADRAGHQDGHPVGVGGPEPPATGAGGADRGRGPPAAGDGRGDRARSCGSPTSSRAQASTAGRSGPREMAFLMHRSLSMGVPAPMHAGAAGGRWEPDDISGFFTRRRVVLQPTDLLDGEGGRRAQRPGRSSATSRCCRSARCPTSPGRRSAGTRGCWPATSSASRWSGRWPARCSTRRS